MLIILRSRAPSDFGGLPKADCKDDYPGVDVALAAEHFLHVARSVPSRSSALLRRGRSWQRTTPNTENTPPFLQRGDQPRILSPARQ